MKTIWLFACGMRRSASTLQYHLIREVIERDQGLGIGWVTWQKFDETYNEYNGQHKYVVLKTHSFTPKFSSIANSLFDTSQARAFYIYRNLSDVAQSLLQFKNSASGNTTAENIIKELEGVLIERDDWLSLSSHLCYTSQYSVVTQNIVSIAREIEQIADFLGFIRAGVPIQYFNIAHHHTLEAHKKLIAEQKKRWSSETLFWQNHISDHEVELSPEIDAWLRTNTDEG